MKLGGGRSGAVGEGRRDEGGEGVGGIGKSGKGGGGGVGKSGKGGGGEGEHLIGLIGWGKIDIY